MPIKHWPKFRHGVGTHGSVAVYSNDESYKDFKILKTSIYCLADLPPFMSEIILTNISIFVHSVDLLIVLKFDCPHVTHHDKYTKTGEKESSHPSDLVSPLQ